MGQYFSTSKAGDEADKAEELTSKVTASLEQPLFGPAERESPPRQQITNLPPSKSSKGPPVAAGASSKTVVRRRRRRRVAATSPSSSLYAVLPSALLHTTTTAAYWSNYKRAKKLFSVDLLNTNGRIGIYLPHERKIRIAKFHAKQRNKRRRGKATLKSLKCDTVVSSATASLDTTTTNEHSRSSSSQPTGSLSMIQQQQQVKEKLQSTAPSETTTTTKSVVVALPCADLVVSSSDERGSSSTSLSMMMIQQAKEKKLPSAPSSSSTDDTTTTTNKKLIDLVNVVPNLCIPQGTPQTAILPSSLLVSSSSCPAYYWSNYKQTKKLFFMDVLNTGGRIGIYLPEERKARIAKFHSKFHAKRRRRKRSEVIATSLLKCASTTTSSSLDDATDNNNNSRSPSRPKVGDMKPPSNHQTANQSTLPSSVNIVVSSEKVVVPHHHHHHDRCRVLHHVPASSGDDNVLASDDEHMVPSIPSQTRLKSMPSKDCMVSSSEQVATHHRDGGVLPSSQPPKCSLSMIQQGKEKLSPSLLTTEKKLTGLPPSTDLVVSSNIICVPSPPPSLPQTRATVLPSSLVTTTTTKQTKTGVLNANATTTTRTGICLPEKARGSKVRAKRRTLTFKQRIREPYRPRMVNGKPRHDGKVVKETA